MVEIPFEVKAEVVDRGREKGSGDAVLVDQAIREGWILAVKVDVSPEYARVCELAGVQRGEAAVLKHAQERRTVALLDDLQARTLARSLGIPVKGTLGILVDSVEKRLLEKRVAMEKLEQLLRIMYLSGDLYRLIRKTMEED